ncbi:UrcA family protein [Blastomonas sp. SL216]|uniref:UrcA family protein n=1 Tax=Blastomonas sp. SL216 TaxID=2995169 RepID=UPI0023771A17|nr:UrcA family protein [Blastomonas sp. SL216]
MTKIFTALALAALTIPAIAAPAQNAQSMPVPINHLDLASTDGQRSLARRIHRAAQALCAIHAVDSLPQAQRSERRCIRETQMRALAAARTQHAALAAVPARMVQPGIATAE